MLPKVRDVPALRSPCLTGVWGGIGMTGWEMPRNTASQSSRQPRQLDERNCALWAARLQLVCAEMTRG